MFEHFLLRRRVDAVIAVSLELTPDETGRLLDMRKPIVGIGGPIPGVRTLSVDNIAVSRLATEHLLALGHRRIAHIGGDETYDHDFHQPTNRRVGYEAALQAAGIPVDPTLYKAARFTIQDGHRAAKRTAGRSAEAADRDFRGIRRDGVRRPPRRARSWGSLCRATSRSSASTITN